MKLLIWLLVVVLFLKLDVDAQRSIQYYIPVNFSEVQITDHFWKPKIDLVATKSLQACIYQTEIATPRIQNFINAAHHTGTFKGIYYDDSDVYKALEAMGGNPHDGAKVVAKMKEMPTDDPLFGKGTIRVDGRKIHPAYLVEVKKPSESKGPWDYYKVRATIPADQAFRPLADGGCPLVK
jgi:hypothetical protein